MPWLETDVIKERTRFVQEFESGLFTMSELCERFGISRQTGHTMWQRYQAEGLAGLQDRVRGPKSCPHKTPQEVEQALVQLRQAHPHWGPVTLLSRLAKLMPGLELPAASTAGEILNRHGLVTPRRRRAARRHPGRPYVQMHAPNDVWTADFKGEFLTRDHRYCYPLTIADGCSRYLLHCRGQHSVAYRGTRAGFEQAFRTYGLPRQILTDNGTPFASCSIGGLSRLSAWWIKLGIQPVRIQPGRPQQNGRHERMHRTLKAEATRPPAANLGAQQRQLERFRREYNEERPHRALDGEVPASCYRRSVRPYPERMPAIEYPGHFRVLKVCANGCLSWRRGFIFVSQVLVGEPLGLEPEGDGIWSVHFGPVWLARFDEREGKLHDAV
ncbi:MAG TPA: IS481 family transposase [Burkholderiales bacterium]|jgi:transposase InsO family protein|nr:IS481 family transposase [Burkholderiales bacterium]